jgi:hypothetical protein
MPPKGRGPEKDIDEIFVSVFMHFFDLVYLSKNIKYLST